MSISAFILYNIIVTFTPGPTNIMILATVREQGIRKALEYSIGAILALFIMLTMSAGLNDVLNVFLPQIVQIVGVVGALYMLYLAWKVYHLKSDGNSESAKRPFINGFLMQFVNPKVVLFTLTVIANFIIPYYHEFHEIMIFVIVITCIGMAAFLSWIVFGAVFQLFLQRYQKICNLVMSLFLVYCAIEVSGVTSMIAG